MDSTQATASFGFRDVPAAEKQSLVREVFDAVSSRYDVMNDAMSLGLHRVWKERLIDQLKPRAGMQLLDLAGGTGDVAFRAMSRCPDIDITLSDINANMLNEGRNRAINNNLFGFESSSTSPRKAGRREPGGVGATCPHTINFACGNAECLPFASTSFDAVTIAFGLRNVTHTAQALREIHRVLKIGGHFLCLEFSHVPQGWLQKIYDTYSFHIIPPMGKMLAGDAAPYRYLVESIRRFPKPEVLEGMMRECGFGAVSHTRLSGGVVAIHSGWRV